MKKFMVLLIVTLTLGGCALQRKSMTDYLATLGANLQMIADTTIEPTTKKLSVASLKLVSQIKTQSASNQKLIDALKRNEGLQWWLNMLIFGSVMLTSVGMAFSFFISFKIGMFFSTIGVINVVLAIALQQYLWLIGLVGVGTFVVLGIYFAYEFWQSKRANTEIVTDIEVAKSQLPDLQNTLKAVTVQSPSTKKIVAKVQSALPPLSLSGTDTKAAAPSMYN